MNPQLVVSILVPAVKMKTTEKHKAKYQDPGSKALFSYKRGIPKGSHELIP